MTDDKTAKLEEAIELHEASYARGSRMAWRRMLQTCLGELRADGEPTTDEERLGRLVAEREDVVRALRAIYEELGWEWPEDLSLADVIEKDFAPQMFDKFRDG